MTTLTTMKSRIASELRRSDLTTHIANAISTAIQAYEHERWFFNESRENTFSTIVEQQNYGAVEASFIGLISKLDYLYIEIGDQPFELLPRTMKEVEEVANDASFLGQPSEYAWYDEQLWLYPVPNEVWTIRVGAVLEPAAPATDGELNNPWMTIAERLIRSRAKYEIALHVLRDLELAQTMTASVEEAYDQLNVRTTRKVKTGGGRIKAMNF